jgi:hypothetical protein
MGLAPSSILPGDHFTRNDYGSWSVNHSAFYNPEKKRKMMTTTMTKQSRRSMKKTGKQMVISKWPMMMMKKTTQRHPNRLSLG